MTLLVYTCTREAWKEGDPWPPAQSDSEEEEEVETEIIEKEAEEQATQEEEEEDQATEEDGDDEEDEKRKETELEGGKHGFFCKIFYNFLTNNHLAIFVS